MKDILERFHKALEKISWPKMPSQFQEFPLGTCGDISDILAEHLYEQGFGSIDYVCGIYNGRSHAWLEISGYAVDITANQFSDISANFLYQPPEIWHYKFKEKTRRKAGYKTFHGPAIPDIEVLHDEIIAKLENVTIYEDTHKFNQQK